MLLGKCVGGRLNVVIKLLVKHMGCTKCFIGSAGAPGRSHSNIPAARIKQGAKCSPGTSIVLVHLFLGERKLRHC